MEIVLTFGLVSVILGTASGAQNIGIIGALGVGAYIALAGLWGSPISGASMNPARTFGPDVVGPTFTPTGCTSSDRSSARSSVGFAFVLRGSAAAEPYRARRREHFDTEVARRTDLTEPDPSRTESSPCRA